MIGTLPNVFYQLRTADDDEPLVEHGHFEQAQKSLHWLREGSFSETEIDAELARIRENVESHRAAGEGNWLSLFRDRNLFERLWRASLLQFMAQMCGATAMKYYLPTLWFVYTY